jgi:arsenate reductase
MAAALLERAAGDRVRVRSAGTTPADEIHASVRTVMSEIGIDLHDRKPQRLSIDTVRESDVVITMGCGDACPVFPGKRYEDWPVPDPAGKDVAEVRSIRDDIARRVETLVAGLTTELAR